MPSPATWLAEMFGPATSPQCPKSLAVDFAAAMHTSPVSQATSASFISDLSPNDSPCYKRYKLSFDELPCRKPTHATHAADAPCPLGGASLPWGNFGGASPPTIQMPSPASSVSDDTLLEASRLTEEMYFASPAPVVACSSPDILAHTGTRLPHFDATDAPVPGVDAIATSTTGKPRKASVAASRADQSRLGRLPSSLAEVPLSSRTDPYLALPCGTTYDRARLRELKAHLPLASKASKAGRLEQSAWAGLLKRAEAEAAELAASGFAAKAEHWLACIAKAREARKSTVAQRQQGYWDHKRAQEVDEHNTEVKYRDWWANQIGK